MNCLRTGLTTLFVCLAVIVPDASRANTQASVPDTTAIQQALAALDQYKTAQINARVQNPDLSYGMRKAIVLANLLLNNDGTLNTSLCQTLKSYFVPQQPLQYEVNIGKILDQLDSSWQSFFDSVKQPADPHSMANLVIKALFSLRADDQITDLHAKKAVLAAMFAPFNQGPVGDCFAVSDLIRDHQEYYHHTSKDYAQIVQNGYLTRTVDKQIDNFFFLPAIADEDCSRLVNIDNTGKIAGTNVLLLNAPGFAAAFNIMGGLQDSQTTSKIVQLLFQGSSKNQIQVSIPQVIEAFAKIIFAANPHLDKDTLVMEGKYAFSSLTNNPVLRATEYAFASMAEDRTHDYVRGNINDCVAQALKSTWSSLSSNPQVNTFKQTFAAIFNSSFRLIYNGDIPLLQVSADGTSTDGGFQLYKRDSGNMTLIGVRVKTPQDFRQLVIDALTATEEKLGSTDQINQIANQLIKYIHTDTFLKNALWDYDPSNRQESDPITYYQTLSRTPMQSCDGDNPYEVDDIDTGTTYDYDVKTYNPKNARDLILWCMNLAKIVPSELIPMDSPQHSFNFDPTNPDMAAYIKSGMTADQWLRQMLIVPGLKVSTHTIDLNTKKTLANIMLNIVGNYLPSQSKYKKLVNKLFTQQLTVQAYAQDLVDGINNLLGSNANQAAQVGLILDSVLLQVLAQNDKTIICQSTIKFAFSNWNDGTKDIYFCAYFNPRTTQVGFGYIEEDKTNLQPMDENAWVNNLRWDVDLRPFAPPQHCIGFYR